MRFEIAGLCFTNAEGAPFFHDLGMVGLSYFIVAVGSFTALEMIERWRNARGAQARIWQFASAAALGGSVWSMHFIATLSLKIGLPMTYSPGSTALSLVIVIGAVWCGLQSIRASASWLRVCGAGTIVGLGIAGMHYLGMAAIRFPGALAYKPTLWALSLLVAIATATVALWLSLRLQRMWQRASAALIMGGGICAMHYTGMAASVFEVDPLSKVVPGLPHGPMVTVVTATTLALMLCALAFVATDRRLLAAAIQEAETLRGSNDQLASANAELELRRQQLDVVLDNIDQGVCFYDGAQRLLVWNRRYAEIYSLPPDSVRVGLSLEEIVEYRQAAGTTPRTSALEYLVWRSQIVDTKLPSNTTVTLRNDRVIAISHQPIPDRGWVATHQDITERQRTEAQIVFMARHDALTKLPNRVLFHERLEQAIEMVGRGVECAILCLDLDHFKLINDTLGHPIGDGLLQAAANRLQACVREVDTVARLGGDEFAIIQLDVKQPDDASLLANRILAAFSRPFDVDGHQIPIGVSIGVAVAPGDGYASGKLLKNADIALYLAKTEGRGTARFFEPEMDARIRRRRVLELDLRNAIARNEFEVYYQPQVNLAAGTIAEFEALVRWNHPVRGLVSPTEFIPLAEETGMIVPIGEWVLRNACQEAKNWPAEIKVAVNLSPAQLKKSNFVGAVKAALVASALPPDRLELEVTESVLLQDTADLLNALHQLQAMGVTVALDDFGTGYSSLSYLRRFPFDKIKIDQSFVRDLEKNSEAMAIIRAVTGLGQSLSIVTTAEGVETAEQLERLREEGCTTVQGFIFSAPKPASEINAMIGAFHRIAEKAA